MTRPNRKEKYSANSMIFIRLTADLTASIYKFTKARCWGYGLLGSGRTETAKVIFGDEQNYVGVIRLRLGAVRFKAPFQSIKAGLAFCPEDRKAEGIFPEMSVMDNLTMPVLDKLNGVGLLNRRKQAEITDEYIDRMSIKTPNMFAKIKDLSGGNQQKVICPDGW